MTPRIEEEGPREQILRTVAGAPATVEQLAAQLGVTPNAVRHQLARLERDGLVERQGTLRGPRRPSHLYGLTGRGADALSRAYLPCLLELLSVLAERLPDASLRRLMVETGERLAGTGQPPSGSLRERAAAGRTALEALGATVTQKPLKSGVRLEGASCPLGAAAQRTPATCQAVAALLHRATGLVPTVECETDARPRPRCRFTLA